jgi:hypothetical protein
MKRIVRLTESDLIKLVNKVIKEDYNFNKMISPDLGYNRPPSKDSRSKHYSQRTPEQRSNYLAKKQADSDMYDYYGKAPGFVYGDEITKYKMADNDRLEINYVDDEDIFMDGPMDEATEEVIKKTTYTKSDIDNAKQKGVGIDVNNGTVTPTEDGGMVVTSESDNPFADVPMWKGRGRK